jgi:hypothetical protein
MGKKWGIVHPITDLAANTAAIDHVILLRRFNRRSLSMLNDLTESE